MSKLKLIVLLVMLTFVITPTAFSMVNSSDLNISGKPNVELNIGDKVSDFTINNYDGSSYTLSKNSGYTVVMFWSCECPFVQPYTERISSLAKDYSSKGITFWAVNSNVTESTDRVKEHAKEKGYPFPVLKDDKSAVADLFNAQRTPEVFVINNSDMTLVYHGRIDDDKDASKVSSSDLKNALDNILAGQPVAVSTTKSFGCGVKRSESK